MMPATCVISSIDDKLTIFTEQDLLNAGKEKYHVMRPLVGLFRFKQFRMLVFVC